MIKFEFSFEIWGLYLLAAKGPPVQRAPLKHRDYHVDLESRLGKSQVEFFFYSLLTLSFVVYAGSIYIE